MNKNNLSPYDVATLESRKLTVDERQFLERLWSAKPNADKKFEVGLLGRIVGVLAFPLIVVAFAAELWFPGWKPAGNVAEVALWIVSLFVFLSGAALLLGVCGRRYGIEQGRADADEALASRSLVRLLPPQAAGFGCHAQRALQVCAVVLAAASGHLATSFLAALSFMAFAAMKAGTQRNVRLILSRRVADGHPASAAPVPA